MTSLQPRDATEQLPYVQEEDWDDEDMPVRPVRKRLGPWSLALIGAVIAAGAFYGGVVTEKHHLPSSAVSSGGGGAGAARAAAAAAGAGAGTRTGAAGAAGAGAGAAGAAGAGAGTTFGTVKLVDGNNVYVQDATGTITKVATTSQSTITITSTGKVSSIKPGDTVIVRGSTGTNGIVNATAITDAGAGGSGLGGFGGGFRRGAGGGGGAGTASAGGGGAGGGGAGGGQVVIAGGGG